MRVAILGTGKMGGAMARRLNDAGHEVTLWNRTRARAELLGVGKVADTPAEAARSSEIVISMLTDADAVRWHISEKAALHRRPKIKSSWR